MQRAVPFALILMGAAAGADETGWRADGSGRYPDATPPTTWSATENILWKTPLPGQGFGSPIVVGNRVFVVSHPADLLCVGANDGKILWRRTATAADVLGQEKARDLEAQLAAIEASQAKVKKQIKAIDPLDIGAIEKLKQQIKELKAKAAGLCLENPIATGRAGNAAGTPVSDGKRVFAAFGSGIVAAYTVEGKPLWMRFVEGSRLGWGHASSPVLTDGRLIVHYHHMMALDATTGEEAWRAKITPRYATPLVARAGDERVLVTPSGAFLRVADGKTIARATFRVSECSPILHEGTVFTHQKGKVMAFRLPGADGSADLLNPTWEAPAGAGRRTPSAVVHDGLIYGATTDGILDVYDAGTGDLVYKSRLGLKRMFSSLTVAGDRIYAFGTRGGAVVFETGREFKESARNQLEECETCPVFSGSRIYLRCKEHLYCIGRS